ncbi:MAG: hypothetical protein JXA68_00260 [Ignavibacteriales bacterium]|nr:hypothetical protein [Ignavibacteriales bacterium]
MKLFRAVKLDDRFPPDGIYHVITTKDKDGSRYYESALFENGILQDDFLDVEYWLEEVHIPSEKEAGEEFKEYMQMDIVPDKDDPEYYDYSWGRVVWMACYDHIKKLLGG